MLKIKNDIHLNLAEGKPTGLVLLDLSAAFDTIHHGKLLKCLNKSFGFSGHVLDWFKAHVSDRSQSVKVGDEISDPKLLNCGVPQGSVLGPLLFIMYNAPLSGLISGFQNVRHNL